MANDLSTCNCCPTVSPCSCVLLGATPCCWTMSGATHCSFSPSGSLCRRGYDHSFRAFGDGGEFAANCLWLSEATWVLVESAGGKFAIQTRLLWALLKTVSGYQLLLCINRWQIPGDGSILPFNLLELARWLPADGSAYDPLFDVSAQTFNFDRLLAGATTYPSVINCDFPSGCGTSVVADGSNLPQSITLTPSCFIATDACKSACVQPDPLPADESGCGNCSSGGLCSDGTFPANCTWEWNAISEVWEVTSDDCSNSPDSGCGCVPMLTGCDTDDPGEPSLTTGPCYDAASHSEGVRVCDP